MRECPKKLIVEARVKGFFVLDGKQYRNKFTRNMGYVIDGLLRRANVSVFDEGGTSRTAYTSYGGLLYTYNSSSAMGQPLHFQYGTSTATPTVTDNNLGTPDANARSPTNYVDTVEGSNETFFLVAARWAPDVSRTYSEIGLKWLFDGYYGYATLISRSVLSPSVARSAYTEYYDGYVLRFPASYTLWFARALLAAAAGHYYYGALRGPPVTAVDGVASLRAGDVFAGTLDVRIGSDNTSPSPTHSNLLSPIASLSSQSQSVEVDTSLQEVRVVRTGTYTPTTNVTLGEIGLFAQLRCWRAGSAVTPFVMLCRVALSTPVTLYAGTTYTLGIALVFS